MESYTLIVHKLSAFISKYYKARMIRGAFLFLAWGLLFWISLLSLEYVLWLDKGPRMVLFGIALSGTIFLTINYIGMPLIFLFKLKSGLTPRRAAGIIGRHFPEVNDRLLNLLQLAEDEKKTELLLASIEQRSRTLSLVPFQKAIDLKKSLKYARLLLIPLLIVMGIWVSGRITDFFHSFERVVNYDLAFERPAPFRFILLNERLKTVEKRDFTLQVITEGDLSPERAVIVIDGKERMMAFSEGKYSFTFSAPEGAQEFYFSANGIRSRTYTLETIAPPIIEQMITILDYPSYTGRQGDTLNGTGNAVIPEGTKVEWQVRAGNTQKVALTYGDSSLSFSRERERFTLQRTLTRDMTYELTTSNDNLQDYERLGYRLSVIRDVSPTLEMEEIRDTITNTRVYQGNAIDDYAISRLALYCYEKGKEEEPVVLELDRPDVKEYTFLYEFPTGLELEKGKTYSYFFQITDNDGLRGGKSTRSRVFSTAVLDDTQERARQLQEQKEALRNGDKSIERMSQQQDMLRELEKNQKEKNTLDYNDQKEIREFLKAQRQQEALMEKFSRQLLETMDKGQGDDFTDKLLKERLERQEMEAKKNERLLEELQKLADKIDKEELAKRLEEVGKSQQNSKRNLAQLLELTKRYYVTEKASELSFKLNKLAEKEEILSKIDQEREFNLEEQKDINERFDDIGKELDELRILNQELAKPVPMNTNEEKEEEVKQDLKEVLEELRTGSEKELAGSSEKEELPNSAKKKQRQAAAKMKQMGEALQQSAMSGGGETMAEDAEMLRQILDNLLVFSLKQEVLLDRLSGENGGDYSVSVVREEQDLRSLFEHVDDSLFTLSLRQVEITEFVNEQITEVYYNIEGALENLSDGQVYRAAAHQQAVLTSANALADFLADILGNMQQSLAQGQGKGSSKDGFQLPDIIKGQQNIQGSMQELGEAGKGNKEGSDEEGEDGSGKGKEGKNGRNGKEGLSGEENLGEIYEIYKQQQSIRAKLEEQLRDMIDAEDKGLAMRLVRQMEEFEKDLLENGITERNMNRVNRIKQQLIKLENAAMEQGEKDDRESDRAKEQFMGPLIKKREEVLKDEEILELLQRQALPLREFYGEAIKRYFQKND